MENVQSIFARLGRGYARIGDRSFRVLLRVTTVLYRFNVLVLAYPLLRLAVLFARPDNAPFQQIYLAVETKPHLFKDEGTRRFLFGKHRHCPGFGALLNAAYDFGSGDLDNFVQSANQAFVENPECDLVKLVRIHAAHIVGDFTTVARLLSDPAFGHFVPKPLKWRLRHLSGPSENRVRFRSDLHAHVQSLGETSGKISRTQLFKVAKSAIDVGEFPLAEGLLNIDSSPYRTLFVRDRSTSDFETAAIHLNYAMNRHYGRHKDTGYFSPAHWEMLSERTATNTHPLIENLAQELLRWRRDASLNEYPTIALFCPVHREADLKSILQQARQQTTPKTTTYVVLNNLDRPVTPDMVHALWQCDRPLRVMEFGAMPSIGSVIHRALDQIDDDFFLKLDGDCLYGPAYTADMVGQCITHRADFIAKRARFQHFKGLGIMDLQFPTKCFQWLEEGDWAGGSAFAAPTEIWRRHSHSKSAKVGEDVALLRAVYNSGHRIYLADPFNGISVRSSDREAHTFKESQLFLGVSTGAYTVCRDTVDLTDVAYV